MSKVLKRDSIICHAFSHLAVVQTKLITLYTISYKPIPLNNEVTDLPMLLPYTIFLVIVIYNAVKEHQMIPCTSVLFTLDIDRLYFF